MFKKLIFTAGFVAVASSVSAAPLSLSVGAGGGWSGATTPGGVCVDIDNVNTSQRDEIRWGGGSLEDSSVIPDDLLPWAIQGDACWNAGNNYFSGVSGYNFDPFEGANVSGTEVINLGLFEHENFAVSDAITGVDYTLNINHNSSGDPLSILLDITHDETFNSDYPNCCADIVTIGIPSLSRLFQVGSDLYLFELLGFGADAASAQLGSLLFTSPEGQTNQTFLWAQITQQNPVPEPATLTMLGTGLLGLGAAARRRMRKARQA